MLDNFLISFFLNKKFHHPLIINSIPKSGTHLLGSIIKHSFSKRNIFSYSLLRGIDFRKGSLILTDYLKFFNNNFEVKDFAEKKTIVSFWISQIRDKTAQDLFNIPKSRFVQTHLGYSKYFSNLFEKKKYKQIIILRNPESVIVSSEKWIMKNKKEDLFYPKYSKVTKQERYKTLLFGNNNFYTLPLYLRYRNMINWKIHTNCLFLRYEDLIGGEGGGSLEAQNNSIKKILNYLEIEPTGILIKNITKNYYRNTPTFRKGRIQITQNENKFFLNNKINKELTKIKANLDKYCPTHPETKKIIQKI